MPTFLNPEKCLLGGAAHEQTDLLCLEAFSQKWIIHPGVKSFTQERDGSQDQVNHPEIGTVTRKGGLTSRDLISTCAPVRSLA